MKLDKQFIAKVREVVEENELDSKYGCIGIRVQEEPFELGEMTHVSHVWDDGDDTGIELNGVCATNISARQFPQYSGEHVALVCGNRYEMGEDEGEIVIEDATVEYIFC